MLLSPTHRLFLDLSLGSEIIIYGLYQYWVFRAPVFKIGELDGQAAWGARHRQLGPGDAQTDLSRLRRGDGGGDAFPPRVWFQKDVGQVNGITPQ